MRTQIIPVLTEELFALYEISGNLYFSSGQTVSFSDGDTSAKFRMGLMQDYHKIFLQGEKGACHIQISGKNKNLRVSEQIHSNHEGEQEIVRLIQWEVIPDVIMGEKGEQYYGVSKYTVW